MRVEPLISSAAPTDEHIDSFRKVLQTLYCPGPVSDEAAAHFDWEAYPRLSRAMGAARHRPASDARFVARLREVLELAIAEGLATDDGRPDPDHWLVLRWKCLEKRSWPALESACAEKGWPHCRNTLRDRMRTATQRLLEWGAEAAPEPVREKPAERVDPVPMLAAFWFSLVILLVPIAMELQKDSNPDVADSSSWRTEFLGRSVPIAVGATVLPPPLPQIELPQPERRWSAAMPLQVDGKTRVLLGTSRLSEDPGRVVLWDPESGDFEWEVELRVPSGLLRTHEGVPASATREPYGLSRFVHTGPDATLGDHALGVFQQLHSPTLVASLDLEGGAIEGYYVHPGHLESATVVDLDGTGEPVAVLGGYDSVVDRPVVVALRTPIHGLKTASTVPWSEGVEWASARVVLPAVPELGVPTITPRLSALGLDDRCWEESTATLTVGVRAGPTICVYHARLGAGLQPKTPAVLVLDEDRPFWARLGFDDAGELPELEANVDHIPGTGLRLADVQDRPGRDRE